MRAILAAFVVAIAACGGPPDPCPTAQQPCQDAGSYRQECFPLQVCCGGIGSYTDGTGIVYCGISGSLFASDAG